MGIGMHTRMDNIPMAMQKLVYIEEERVVFILFLQAPPPSSSSSQFLRHNAYATSSRLPTHQQ